MSISSASVAMACSAESCGLHDHAALVHDLARVDRGHDQRVRVDLAEFAEDAEFEVREARALAGAAARAGHRHAADDAERQVRHVLECDRLAMFEEPWLTAASSNETPLRAQPLRVEPDEGNAVVSSGTGRVDGLAVVERAQPHRDLRRVGIAFDDARPRQAGSSR